MWLLVSLPTHCVLHKKTKGEKSPAEARALSSKQEAGSHCWELHTDHDSMQPSQQRQRVCIVPFCLVGFAWMSVYECGCIWDPWFCKSLLRLNKTYKTDISDAYMLEQVGAVSICQLCRLLIMQHYSYQSSTSSGIAYINLCCSSLTFHILSILTYWKQTIGIQQQFYIWWSESRTSKQTVNVILVKIIQI